MTSNDHAELRRLAEAATPGPWTHYRDKLRPQFNGLINEVQAKRLPAVVNWAGFDDGDRKEPKHAANAAYIAAANPKVVLALLDALDSRDATIAEQAAEIERLRKTAIDATAHLAAAISLLEHTPKAKKAAPSDKMFDQMLKDYRASLKRARTALETSTPAPEDGR